MRIAKQAVYHGLRLLHCHGLRLVDLRGRNYDSVAIGKELRGKLEGGYFAHLRGCFLFLFDDNVRGAWTRHRASVKYDDIVCQW